MKSDDDDDDCTLLLCVFLPWNGWLLILLMTDVNFLELCMFFSVCSISKILKHKAEEEPQEIEVQMRINLYVCYSF